MLPVNEKRSCQASFTFAADAQRNHFWSASMIWTTFPVFPLTLQLIGGGTSFPEFPLFMLLISSIYRLYIDSGLSQLRQLQVPNDDAILVEFAP